MPRADNCESQADNQEVPLSDFLTDYKGGKPFSDEIPSFERLSEWAIRWMIFTVTPCENTEKENH